MKIPYTKIEANISKYLFVELSCPKCNEPVVVSLDSLYAGKPLQCIGCNQKGIIIPPWRTELFHFVQSFNNLGARLRKTNQTLMFFHNMAPTLWSRDDKT